MESTDYNDIKVDDVKYHQFKDEDLYLLFSRVSKNDADALHALTKFRKILVSESYSGTNGKNIEVDGVIYQTQSIDDAYLDAQQYILGNVEVAEVVNNIKVFLKRLNLEGEVPEWYKPSLDSKCDEFSAKFVEDEDEGFFEVLFEGTDAFFYFYLWE